MKTISKAKEFSGENAHKSIKDLIGKKIPQKSQILSYLKSFEPDCAAGMLLVDEVSGKETALSVEGFEDGIYYWDSREIYHFEKYDMELDKDFIRHVLSV